MTGQRPLALTMGEPAGIGGEIALKAWKALTGGAGDQSSSPFFVIDRPERLEKLAALPGCQAPVVPIEDPKQASEAFVAGLPVLPLQSAVPAICRDADSANAKAVIESIDTAIDLVARGAAAAMITNPIQKAPLMTAGFGFPGHTEYLQHRAGVDNVVMMLEIPGLRVALVTIHIPLADVPGALSTAGIIEVCTTTHQSLRRQFGIEAPRLAVAGLNPHAGEEGKLGDEEQRIIRPAIDFLRAESIDCRGPFPADTMFHPTARATYDAAVCLYHDQGLAPLKAIDFDNGVNVTLGLPWVRTSPDHGTALDIARTGTASPASLLAALRTAGQMAASGAAG